MHCYWLEIARKKQAITSWIHHPELQTDDERDDSKRISLKSSWIEISNGKKSWHKFFEEKNKPMSLKSNSFCSIYHKSFYNFSNLILTSKKISDLLKLKAESLKLNLFSSIENSRKRKSKKCWIKQRNIKILFQKTFTANSNPWKKFKNSFEHFHYQKYSLIHVETC